MAPPAVAPASIPSTPPIPACDPGSPWPKAEPQEVGLDPAILETLIGKIQETPPPDFRALVVARDGKLVVEEYFHSFTSTDVHDVRSAGKSVTSLLTGIAVDQGKLSVSDRVVDVLSDVPTGDAPKGDAPTKRDITVEHLLTMSSGLASDDDDDDSPGTEGRMDESDDFTRFALQLPMAFTPGERYAYSSAVAFLMGVVVERVMGMTLEEHARRHLFGPLGICELRWRTSPQGHTTGMGNLFLRAVDFAKLGQLMLDHGRWGDRVVLSPEWVEHSLQKAHDIDEVDPFANGYGYMWFLVQDPTAERVKEYYFASGNGGNKLFVVPQERLVVATMSAAYGQGYGHPRSHNILAYLLTALQ